VADEGNSQTRYSADEDPPTIGIIEPNSIAWNVTKDVTPLSSKNFIDLAVCSLMMAKELKQMAKHASDMTKVDKWLEMRVSVLSDKQNGK
jgi:hypothetical protein